MYITEYDLNIADRRQAGFGDAGFNSRCSWQNEHVKGITYWGYIVGSTWETNTGLMQSSGTMRPAMTWLMNFLGPLRRRSLAKSAASKGVVVKHVLPDQHRGRHGDGKQEPEAGGSEPGEAAEATALHGPEAA